MASFPALTAGAVCQYPLADTYSYGTQVHQFENDREQRYKSHRKLRELGLQFLNIPEADYYEIEEFFDARAGAFDATWDITVDGILIENCVFVDDVLTRTESRPGYVSFNVRIQQVKS